MILFRMYFKFITGMSILYLFKSVCHISLGLGRIYANSLLKIFNYISHQQQRKSTRKVSFSLKNGLIASSTNQQHETILSDDDDDELFLDPIDDNCTLDIDGLKITSEKSHCARKQLLKRISESSPPYFALDEVVDLTRNGIETIIDDEVTKRFASVDELNVWNLLTRTHHLKSVTSTKAWTVWVFGFILRYFILFPCRLMIFIIGLLYCGIYALTMKLYLSRQSRFRHKLRCWMGRVLFRMTSEIISAIITVHNPENIATPGSICVANHTSPIDVVILSTNGNYALTGQRQTGFFGLMECLLGTTGDSIWFDRSQSDDRLNVLKSIHNYVSSKSDKLPVLLFPEGTCINNTSVMMFRKGSFEIDVPVYPVAIKYDPRLGDPFWNSHRHGFFHYFIRMMTSWAIVVDVYYLPKMQRMPNESAIEFSKRVKAAIANVGGFVNMEWDGMLKRTYPKVELKQREQLRLSERLRTN